MLVAQGQQVETRLGWLRAALLMAAAGWGANQFSPLLGAYRAELALSATTVTGLFAIYVAGMIPGLLLGGPGADAFGRRPAMLGAVGVSLLSTVALMGDQTVLLGVGRFGSGVATGAVLAAGSTWVKELSQPPYDPHALPGAGARRASLLLSAGFGVGGLVAAVLAQWISLAAAYVPHLVLSVVAIAFAWALPETRSGKPARRGPIGLRDPRFRRLVVPVALWVFAAPSTGFAVLPSLVERGLAGYETAFAGLAIAAVLGAGLLIQPVGRRLAERGVLVVAVTGLGSVAAGMLVGALAAWSGQPLVALVADLLLGVGYGLCVTFGLTEIGKIAPPSGLARLSSIYWALTYVGFCAPYVFSLLSHVALPPVILGVAGGLAALTGVYVLVRGSAYRYT
ncbi:MFS transporter [Amycolatopsis sp. K13G38]|uniref:MFS transporter n=1 Tax=Amycolatopsis acididurans TaxID=2724524 RepID=A0ABX1IZJ9_9PSEU|nr:MFS transporter [Amycolatopsis acididurans]NKQ52943.1 MFS transporter [Amycolatopsis acididurans]